ncbi:DUF5677 domain-containing protein [Sphingobacterium multivorum]|uniref:DUF5677 domain-containing protein n=1 Tax=Sphingobacterium multivorum TaxID=28454 RepID=UPI000E066AB1|nr:DUF5677 domain-containing protein [Sphingobacterium multivorum]QQT45459.1 hypothetical protein I6J00_01860 [Sphingobacterium multivorum]SUJ26149.1 Uncharacterised protein [Sphingobacterium multivorum]
MGNIKKEILNRNLPDVLKNQLDTLSDEIDHIIEFGTKILEFELCRSGDDTDLPPILFLRNLIENMDAASILIRNSSIEPCKILLRTGLENFCSIEYLIMNPEKSRQRSLCFLVWNLIEHNKWLVRTNSESKDYGELKTTYSKDRLMRGFEPLIIENAAEKTLVLKEIFRKEPYSLIKQEYDLTRKKLRKNPAWYSLYCGPQSIKDLASAVDLPALYEILYRGWSHSTHGNNIVQGKLKDDLAGMLVLEPLRSPEDVVSIAQHCRNFLIASFISYVDKRCPELRPELKRFYEDYRGIKLEQIV